jgi:ABC-2 type transport system permease protein
MTVAAMAERDDRPGASDQLPHWGPWKTALAILRRDLFVTGREFPVFLAQVILQPLFLLFVFGKVLTQLGYARPGYEQVLFPGLVALAAVLTGLQSTALPLVIEFSYSNEIEDRLLAPLPTGAVAVEKVVFAAMRACVAAAVMFPLIFTGSSQYPWPSLDHIRWFQVVSALNPMTYVSEGLRGLMAPGVPHIQTWVCFVVAVGSLVVLMVVGMAGFIRRALG